MCKYIGEPCIMRVNKLLRQQKTGGMRSEVASPRLSHYTKCAAYIETFNGQYTS